jgi:hypothetical protein
VGPPSEESSDSSPSAESPLLPLVLSGRLLPRLTAAVVVAKAFRLCLVLFLRRCLDVSDAPPTNPLEFPRNAAVEDECAVAAVVSLSDSVVRICRLAEDLTVSV